MRLIDALTGPDAAFFAPGVYAGLLVALLCGVLSPFVVLKRMVFAGQGVSHGAFGAVGVCAWFGLTGVGQLGVVAGCCLALGVAVGVSGRRDDHGVGGVSRPRGTTVDTALGVGMVVSMAAGALLLHAAWRAGRVRTGAASFESVLFGSLLGLGWFDTAVAAAAMFVGVAVLWWFRRELLLWAFDARGAESFGVPVGRARLGLTLLLSVAVVVSMKLAGVVLATALLVFPGATALRLTERLALVWCFAAVAAVFGMAVGLAAAFRFDAPPGPCVVVSQALLYASACVVVGVSSRVRR